MTAFIGGGRSNDPKITPCNDIPPMSMLAPRHPKVSIKTRVIGGQANVAENTIKCNEVILLQSLHCKKYDMIINCPV